MGENIVRSASASRCLPPADDNGAVAPSSVDFPDDHWEATGERVIAARSSLRRALTQDAETVTVDAKALDIALHAWGIDEDLAGAVGWIREAAKRVMGGNFTFADDDLAVLAHLAERAVKAGLTDGLHPTVAAKAAEACGVASETRRSTVSLDGEGAQEACAASDKPTEPNPCQCQSCTTGTQHLSSCSVHNAPALPNGPCDSDCAEERGEQASIPTNSGGR